MNVKVNVLNNLYNANNLFFPKVEKKRQVAFCKNKNQDSFKKEGPQIEKLFFRNQTMINGLSFKKPVLISDALKFLANTKEHIVASSLEVLFHPSVEFKELAEEISKNEKLKNVKVSSLLGFGAYSLAFETTKGEVLKISDGNQFRNNRNVEWFDLPIREQGRLGEKHYYYFEEKVNSDVLTEGEIREFIREIRKDGFDVIDYTYKFSTHDNLSGDFKKEQFGKSKDGRIYLVDPGCINGQVVQSKQNFIVEKIISFFQKIFL